MMPKDTSDGIGTEVDWYDTFVNFYAIGKADGNIVQSERAADAFLWHTINEYLDVLATEAVEHQIDVRSYSSGFPEL